MNHRHVVQTSGNLGSAMGSELVSSLAHARAVFGAAGFAAPSPEPPSSAAAMTSVVFESLSWGIVVLASSGQVSSVNAAMRAIAEAKDGIGLSARGLKFEDSACDRALRETVGALQSMAGPTTNPDPVWMSVDRPSGKRAYAVAISALNAGAGDPGNRRPTLIRISDPERAADIRTEILQRLFFLTHAEARLTSALIRNGCLSAAAATCGLTEGSARQYIRRIFAKTGTASQVQLVVRIARAIQF